MPSNTCNIARRRRRRHLLLAITAARAVTHVESFSFSQNTAAAREDSNNTPDDASRRSAARSRAAVIAAGSSFAPLSWKQRNDRYSRHGLKNNDFALRAVQHQQLQENDDSGYKNQRDNCDAESSLNSQSQQHEDTKTVTTASVIQRRKFLHNFVASTTALATASSIDTTIDDSSTHLHNPLSIQPEPAAAFEYTYPIELSTPTTSSDGTMDENPSNSLSKLQKERLTNKRSKVIATQNELSSDPLGLGAFSKPYEGILLVTGVSLWTLALWFISGSRSNPLVNPIANVLYDVNGDDNTEWLQNRNEGYFSEYPPQLTLVLSVLFVLFGIVADRSVYFLADGEAGIPVELGGVAAISGAFWEVGRVAAGEKGATKEESERDTLIESEFEEFAERRLMTGRSTLSVHRSEVVKAFRRFNPKYRVENEEYPLTDIEIERLVRRWARRRGIEMSSAGFFSGVGIDSNADAFAPR